MSLENPRTTSVRSRDKDPDTFIGVSLPFAHSRFGWFKSSTTLLQQTKSNMKNLLLTVKGERVNQPELGCDLFNVLFEPMDDRLSEKKRFIAKHITHQCLCTYTHRQQRQLLMTFKR